MSNPYRQLFSTPGTRGFVLAGVLARLPLPMTGIGIITLISQLRGSYALAGALAATFVMTYALLSPRISRWVDRYGQSNVLPVATLISLSGSAVLLVATWYPLGDWSLFLGAFLTGAMPSLSAMVRARWTALHRGQPQLQTAYSLETVLDEVTFIVGPPLSVGLCVGLFPQAGPLLAALLLALGVGALVLQRGSEPPVTKATERVGVSLISLGQVCRLTLLMAAMGVIVGTVDIVSVAFAGERGQPGAASLVLSAYALGSCLAGLGFGALKLSQPLSRLLLLGTLATAASTLPMWLAGSIPWLALAVFVAGLFFAPTMIVAMSLVERSVPEHRLTEGMTWLLAGLNIGVATGAALAGQVVDLWGTRMGFGVAVLAGAGLLLSGWLAARCGSRSLAPAR